MLRKYYERLLAAGIVRTQAEFCTQWLGRRRNYLSQNKPVSVDTLCRLQIACLDRGNAHMATDVFADIRRLVQMEMSNEGT